MEAHLVLWWWRLKSQDVGLALDQELDHVGLAVGGSGKEWRLSGLFKSRTLSSSSSSDAFKLLPLEQFNYLTGDRFQSRFSTNARGGLQLTAHRRRRRP